MKRTAIGGGAYVDEHGGYWARPFIARRRTWRKLKAISTGKAIKEANATEWQPRAHNFGDLARLYIERGCPSHKFTDRSELFIAQETQRARILIEYFGRYTADEIELPELPKYKDWRVKHIKRGKGIRAAVKDGNTLSNILNFGVMERLIKENKVARGRPTYSKLQNVRHCRQVAPASPDVIHLIASELLSLRRSEVLGWQLLFAMFTGCRTSELLRLRLDASTTDQAGFIEDDYLWLNRSKGGVDEYAVIGPEFAQMIQCFRRWHAERHPDSEWYFPSDYGDQPVNPGALGHALTRYCAEFKLAHITPHGLRSFYVTKRRSDGVSDIIIAGEIGDQTVALMQRVYGKRPANWKKGGKKLEWLPEKELPAWSRWAEPASKIIPMDA